MQITNEKNWKLITWKSAYSAIDCQIVQDASCHKDIVMIFMMKGIDLIKYQTLKKHADYCFNFASFNLVSEYAG